MASDRFEWTAGWVGVELVVAADHPDFAVMLDADLGGAKDMAGRVKRDPDSVHRDGLAIRDAGDVGLAAEARSEEAGARFGTEIGLRTGARMIAVGVRDQGTGHPAPRIDVEIARGTEQAFGRNFDYTSQIRIAWRSDAIGSGRFGTNS